MLASDGVPALIALLVAADDEAPNAAREAAAALRNIYFAPGVAQQAQDAAQEAGPEAMALLSQVLAE